MVFDLIEQRQNSTETPEVAVDRKSPATSQKRVCVVVAGSLRRTEAAVCRSGRMSWGICFLPVVKIQDMIESLPRLIKPSDHYPYLLTHVEINDAAKHSHHSQKKSSAQTSGIKMKKSLMGQVSKTAKALI